MTQPLSDPPIPVTVAGAVSPSLKAILTQLDPRHYAMQWIDQRAGYVSRLVDHQPALILVDAVDTDWAFWCTTPKVNSATRRTQIVLVAYNEEQARDALSMGVNRVIYAAPQLDEAGLLSEIVHLIQKSTLIHQADCDQPLPAEALEALARFNAGDYYRQHDLFELLWMQEKGAIRSLYQGILQVGIAYYHIQNGNHRGAVKTLWRSLTWLTSLPDTCRGINIAQLREDVANIRTALETMPEGAISQFDMRLLRPIQYQLPS